MSDVKTKGRLGRILFALAILVTTLLLTEAAARVYVYAVVKQGKLFEPDEALGWRVLPDLDVVRVNANGEPWRIETDAKGIRGPSSWKSEARNRILVLGDSFAFGEGVELDKRFDSLISERRRSWSFINLGVMGYGTDQQIISARPFLPTLKPGDVLVLLTYTNDFFDILRPTFSGRAKPRFEVTSDEITEVPPTLGWLQLLRDRSYVIARIASVAEAQRHESSSRIEDLERGIALYSAIVANANELWGQRGLRVVIANHGLNLLSDPRARRTVLKTMRRLCEGPTVDCLQLDHALTSDHPREFFMRDGHWNDDGHRTVAQALEARLESILGR